LKHSSFDKIIKFFSGNWWLRVGRFRVGKLWFKCLRRLDFPFEKIGVVTSGEMVVDGDFWGTVDWWKEKYDNAIENFLSKEEAGSALSSI